MTSTISVDDHIRWVAAAAHDLARRAQLAGVDADVPTCPRWRVADLLAHQGIVHRWAASHVRGEAEYHVTKTAVLESVRPADLVP